MPPCGRTAALLKPRDGGENGIEGILHLLNVRITPTHARNRHRNSDSITLYRDYPRVAGEEVNSVSYADGKIGSSLHVRGKAFYKWKCVQKCPNGFGRILRAASVTLSLCS